MGSFVVDMDSENANHPTDKGPNELKNEFWTCFKKQARPENTKELTLYIHNLEQPRYKCYVIGTETKVK